MLPGIQALKAGSAGGRVPEAAGSQLTASIAQWEGAVESASLFGLP